MATFEILEFIKRRFGDTDAHWTDGNCYYFAIILKERFKDLKIYYEPVLGHFICGINGAFYDANGAFFPDKKPILFSDLKKTDILWYNRIVEDCIN